MGGLLTGRFLFADTRPRRLLQIHRCKSGWDASQLAGLIASVVIQRMPGAIPRVILETDKTIVFEPLYVCP